MKYTHVLFAVCCLLFSACETSDSSEESFDIETMLNSVSQEIIISKSNAFVYRAEQLVFKAEQLQTGKNLDAFIGLREEWFLSMASWQDVQVVNFGELAKKYYNVSIANWPTNHLFVDQIIAGTDPIDQPFIDGKGASSKGLLGMEYICFDKGQSAASIFSSINDRHINYLLAVAQNNLKYAELIHSYWNENQDDFIAATDNGLEGSVSLMVNQLVHLAEAFGKNKIGRQAGLFNTATKDPQGTECYRSEFSYASLLIGTQSLQDFFRGNASNGPELPGIDDYLNQIQASEALTTEINTHFEDIFRLLKESDLALADDIAQENIVIDNLYEAYKKLVILFDTDVASLLSVTVVPSDADGD